MVTGQIIYRMDLEFIYGQNKKERGNYLEIDTKENGKMEKGNSKNINFNT